MGKGCFNRAASHDGDGGVTPGGSSQTCQSICPSPARPVGEVGWHREKENHLVRAVEHEIQLGKFYHQSHI